MNKDEKLIYENSKGQKIEFSLWTYFRITSIEGLTSLTNEISANRGVNQDGISVNKSNVKERNIIIQGIIKEKTSNTEKFITTFNPKLRGKLIYVNKNEIKSISCIIEKSPTISKDSVPKFQLSIICPMPYWEEYLQQGEIISTLIGGWKFKFKLPFKFKQKGESKKNIFNEGHVETPVEIIFKGPALDPCVINHATGEFIKINRELTSDDTLYITTAYGNKKVEIERNGVRQNAFNYIDLDSTFFQLQVGDNMIEYTTENQLEPQSVEIRYRNRYLGV